MKNNSKNPFPIAAIFLSLIVLLNNCGGGSSSKNSEPQSEGQNSRTTSTQTDSLSQSIKSPATEKEKPANAETNDKKINKVKLNDAVSTATVKLGDSQVQIEEFKISGSGGSAPLYFRPHENESTSGEATREIIKKYNGGSLVELKSKGDRMIQFSLKNQTYTIDPNRIFTAEGIKKTLSKNGGTDAEAEKAVNDFVENLFAEFLIDKNLIIAVHNNTDGEPLSVESYRGSAEVADISVNPQRDIDDFFYVTNQQHFNFFREQGFNVVLQNTAKVGDDGSLSVYCGKRGIAYINVESEHGHLSEQIEMLEAVQRLPGK